jgi:hypothetical protein
MKNIRDTCIQFLKNEDIKRDIKDVIQPICEIIYNELYIYILFICIYNVILIFMIVLIIYLLLNTRAFRNNPIVS